MSFNCLISFSLLLSLAQAQPYIGFPLSQQLPLVARVGEEYKFSLNTQTFRSDLDSVSYKAYSLPDWLSFDSSSLLLTGLPSDEESEGTITFQLEGTDSGGSLNQTCTIYLSSQPAPQVNANDGITTQLESMGVTNGNGGIVLQPNNAFSLKFNSDTFQIPSSSKNNIVDYYGKSANRTSLPSWCYFDSDSLTFYGTAPTIRSQDAPSMQYDLTLIATDYSGYTGAFADFSIVVGGHSLFINGSDYTQLVNTTAGDSFSIDIPLDKIYLDGSKISTDQIGSVDLFNSPSWVSVEGDSSIKGTVPLDQVENVVLNVTLYDIYGDEVYMEFDIDVIHDIFTTSLPDVKATRGSFFTYTLSNSSFSNLEDTDIDAQFSANWLTFFHSNNSFTGQVPTDFDNLDVDIQATMNNMEETETFEIIGVGSMSRSSSLMPSSKSMSTSKTISHSSMKYSSTTGASSSSSATLATSSTSTTSSASSSAIGYASLANNSGKSTNSKSLAIGLGVGIPCFVILVAALFFLCCCGYCTCLGIGKRKRRQSKEKDEESRPYISGPVPIDSNETVDGAYEADKATKNMENLDDVSSYSTARSSIISAEKEESNMYLADAQASTDQLLAEGGVYNSWRGQMTGKFQPRDSLNSLATVATNDLLTVNMVESNNARKSQMNMLRNNPAQNLDRFSYSTSLVNAGGALEPLSEEGLQPSDGSAYSNGSSPDAKLMEFEHRGSVSRSYIFDEQSHHGILEG